MSGEKGMTEEPKNLFMRFPRTKIIREDKEAIWLDLGDAMRFLEQVMGAMTHPDMAVVRKDQEVGE